MMFPNRTLGVGRTFASFFFRASMASLFALALSACFGNACNFEEKAAVTRGEQGELGFYYYCLADKCPIDEGRALGTGGSTHVVHVESFDAPGSVLDELVFTSEDESIFEIEEVGCNGACTIFNCNYDTECEAPYLFHVRLNPLSVGSARLLVHDADGGLVDAAEVTILPATDAGTVE
jgi:hypothetical protein